MKKILLSFLFFVMLFFVGCSTQMTTDVTSPTMNSNLVFNFTTYTYTFTDSLDIFYQSGNPYEDFVILYDKTQINPLTEAELQSLSNLFTVLLSLQIASAKNFQTLLNFSSNELNELSLLYSIALSIEEIVAFNDLKNRNSTLIQDLSANDKIISKAEYYEKRTSVALSSEEIADLNLLQSFYFDTNSSVISVSMRLSSFEQLISAFESYQGIMLTETEIGRLETAYNLMIPLFND